MQAPEAMELLIHHMDRVWVHSDYVLSLTDAQKEEIKTATAVCVAMLNTALPVAKYRAYVEVDPNKPTKPKKGAMVTADYTVCAINAQGVQSGLSSLGILNLDVRILIFEQKQMGADVVSGFQGNTKSQNYRTWYRSIPYLEGWDIPTVQ